MLFFIDPFVLDTPLDHVDASKSLNEREATRPVLEILSVYPGVDTIDVLLSLDQAGTAECIAVEVTDPAPDSSSFRNKVPATGNETYVTIKELKTEHDYHVYCYAENEYEMGPEQPISSTLQVTKTLALGNAPVLLIGDLVPEREGVVLDVLSSDPGTVYCMVVPPEEPGMCKYKIRNEGVEVPVVSFDTKQLSMDSLTPSTQYVVYCTAESTSNVPMRSDVDKVSRSFTTLKPKESPWVFALRILATVFCVCMSGIFSGLNLGVMGLDLISLRMIADTNIEEIGGDNVDPKELADLKRDKHNAQLIYPIRKKGNLLLCTLLIGNVMVNSIISILTADMTTGFIGFLISTCVITAFGEIIPQAYGSRHALEIGAMSATLVRVIIAILWIICKPVSMMLDYFLGDELGAVYNRYQLYTMFELYKEHSTFRKDTISTMQGALVMDTKSILDFMHPLDTVYMLPDTTMLDYATCLDIFRKGYSRIPVFHDDRQNIVGVLHVKELIMIDPNQCVSVQSILKLFPSSILVINSNRTVSDSIRDMVNSHTELAFVSRTIENKDIDNTMEIAGIITLEDCIKAVMRLELVDETSMIEARNASGSLMSVFNNLTLNSLDATTLDILGCFINQALGNQGYHLPEDVIRNLIREGTILKVTTSDPPLYEVGKPCDFATIIMQGVFTMVVGEDRMVTEKPIFSVINLSSLLEDNFM